MSKQVQAMAGNGRKVNKKLKVPETVPFISPLFKIFVSHYPGTFFEEGEDGKVLYERMCRWHKTLMVDYGFGANVLDAVIEYYEHLPETPRYEGGPCRTIKVPDLDAVIVLCSFKQKELSRPVNKVLANEHRAKLKAMTGGKAA